MSRDPFRNYDQWLQQGNPADDPEPEVCDACGELKEWEDDIDVDPDTGRPVASGGGWTCPNSRCGSTPDTPGR